MIVNPNSVKLHNTKQYSNNNDKHNVLLDVLTSTPFGKELLNSELSYYHTVTANIFGYYAIQLGLSKINFLEKNKITNKYILPANLDCEFARLPIISDSLDLIICPHALEFNFNCTEILKECYRTLVPHGKLIVSNFNRNSFLGVVAFLNSFIRINRAESSNVNAINKMQEIFNKEVRLIGLNTLKTTLIDLNFNLIGGKFLNYLPPLNNTKLLDKLEWINKVGDRWLPTNANIYTIIASKEVSSLNPIVAKTKVNPVKKPVPELSGI